MINHLRSLANVSEFSPFNQFTIVYLKKRWWSTSLDHSLTLVKFPDLISLPLFTKVMISLLRSLANVSEFPPFSQFTIVYLKKQVVINLLRSLANVSEFTPVI